MTTISTAEYRRRISSTKALAAHIKEIGNSPFSEYELERAVREGKTHFETMMKLVKLLPDVNNTFGEKGIKARAKFVELIVKAGIQREANGYVFFDAFGIGPRQFDTCFEQGDGKEVAEHLYRLAREDARFARFEPHPEQETSITDKPGDQEQTPPSLQMTLDSMLLA